MSSYREISSDEAPSTICPVCLETWNATDRLPKFLVCHHSICITCAGELQRTARRKRPLASGESLASGASRESLGSLDTNTDDGVVEETASWVRCPMCRTRTFIEDPRSLQTNFYLSGLPRVVSEPRLAIWCETCSKIAAPECSDHFIEPIDEKMRYLQQELVRRTEVLQGYVNESLSAHETNMEVYRWLCGMLRHSHSKVLAALTHAAQYHRALEHHTEALQNLVQSGESLQSTDDPEREVKKMTSLLKELDIQQSTIIQEVELPILNDTFQILRTHQGPKGYNKALVVLDADNSVTLSLFGEKDRQQVADSEEVSYESDESSSSTLRRAMSLRMTRKKRDVEYCSSLSLQKSTLLKEAASYYQRSLVMKDDNEDLQQSMKLKDDIPNFQTSKQLEEGPKHIEKLDILKKRSSDIHNEDLLSGLTVGTQNTEVTENACDPQNTKNDIQNHSFLKEAIPDSQKSDLSKENTAHIQNTAPVEDSSTNFHTTDISTEVFADVTNTDMLQEGMNGDQNIDFLHDTTSDFNVDAINTDQSHEETNDAQNSNLLIDTSLDLTPKEAEVKSPLDDDVVDSLYSVKHDATDEATDAHPSAPPQDAQDSEPEEGAFEILEPVVLSENHVLQKSFPITPEIVTLSRDATFGRRTVSMTDRGYPPYLYDEEPIIEPTSLLNNTVIQNGNDDSPDIDDTSLLKVNPIDIAVAPPVAITSALPDSLTHRRNQEVHVGIPAPLGNTEDDPTNEQPVMSRNRRRRGKRGKRRPSSKQPRRPNPGEGPRQQQQQEQPRPRGRQRSRTRRQAPPARRRSNSMCRVH
ncbi:uncharacterized protein [Palaemon carinicauda]|uniref:uncharacterized protein n=1 Tax=Palaemon carinicauda TaxID=392227 RepID=UPI0035B5D4CA